LSLIVDASVALKWYLAGEPNAAKAQAILDSGEPLLAPDCVFRSIVIMESGRR
jgi:hypothetical protein